MSILQGLVKPMTVITICSAITAGAVAFGSINTVSMLTPAPVVSVKHTADNGANTVDVSIRSATYGPLKNLEYKHIGLDCMATKGYHLRSYCIGGGDGDVLQLRSRGGDYKAFIQACKECNAATAVTCDGAKAKTHTWAANTFAH